MTGATYAVGGLFFSLAAVVLTYSKATMILYAIVVLIFSSPTDSNGRWVESGVYARSLPQCKVLVSDTEKEQPGFTYGCKRVRVGR